MVKDEKKQLNRATIACSMRGSMKAMARPWRIITESDFSQRQKQTRLAGSLLWPFSFSGPETDFLCLSSGPLEVQRVQVARRMGTASGAPLAKL